MLLINDLKKFIQQSRQERWLFVEVFVLLGVMRISILLFPFRRITKYLGIVQGESALNQNLLESTILDKIGWAVKSMSIRTPWESACLAQALTGLVMLSRRGVYSTLCLGVSRDNSGVDPLAAHAWLICDGNIVTGGAGVERYSVISTFNKPAPVDLHVNGTKADQAIE